MNHSFDVEVAKQHGVDAAILIENFRFWIAKNKANGRHYYDGRWWTYNSVKAFSELFPYWSPSQIRRILDRLEASGVLLSGSYNTSGYDRTKWYSLNEQIDLTISANGSDGIGKTLDKTDINTDTGGFASSERRSAVPACPYESIIQAYHEQLPDLPRCVLMSEKRKTAARKFWQWVMTSHKSDGNRRAETPEQALIWIKTYFSRAGANDFLMGRNNKPGPHAGWKADFDYLMTERGMKQVIERTA